MELGITSSFFDDNENYELIFSQMKKYGFEYCDFQEFINYKNQLHSLEGNEFKSYLLNIKKIADKYGIKFYQCHGAWPSKEFNENDRQDFFKVFEKEIYGASILGCKNIVIHPCYPLGYENNDNEDFIYKCNIERFKKLLEYGHKYNVNICIENMPFSKVEIGKMKSIIKIVNEIKDDRFFICFDTGHANMFNDDMYEDIKMCGDKLACLHVHDNKCGLDLHAAPFFGNLDFSKLMKGLNEVNFKGPFNLEIIPVVRDEKVFDAYVNYVKTSIEKIMKY